MVKDAAGVDIIELPSDCGKLRDIGLPEFDVCYAVAPGHALGVAKACDTQVDSENARARRLPGEFHRGQSGPAAGKEDIERLLWLAIVKNDGIARRRGADPPRIGVLLVLLAHSALPRAISTVPSIVCVSA